MSQEIKAKYQTILDEYSAGIKATARHFDYVDQDEETYKWNMDRHLNTLERKARKLFRESSWGDQIVLAQFSNLLILRVLLDGDQMSAMRIML